MAWNGLGIEWLWGLPENHPFHYAGLMHDKAYDMRKAGIIKDKTSKRVDDLFLQDCLLLSTNSLWLKTQAYVFYLMARCWGHFRWPKG